MKYEVFLPRGSMALHLHQVTTVFLPKKTIERASLYAPNHPCYRTPYRRLRFDSDIGFCSVLRALRLRSCTS